MRAPRTPILVVEDDTALRRSIASALREDGHEVLDFGNGAEALAWLADHACPCLVLLDLMMPILDGWTTLHLLRDDPTSFAAVRVIVMSSRLTAVRSGGVVAGVLHKPFALEDLLGAVDEHLPELTPAASISGVRSLGSARATGS